MSCSEPLGSAALKRRLHDSFLASLLATLVGCATPQTGIIRLGDGVLQAANVREAEAYCRTFGEPTRVIKQEEAGSEGKVVFRCD